MQAVRTQIYLTKEQKSKLRAIAKTQSRTTASVIREAIDGYLADKNTSADEALAKTFGAIPDLKVPSRDEWNRGYG